MKVNKVINLEYTTADNIATANINVNFPVKSIHVKSASYNESINGTNGQFYITLTSNLTNGEPMAILYTDTTYSSQQFCDVSFVPYKPIIVNGTYNFYLYFANGSSFIPAQTDYITLILEFNGVDTQEH